MKVYTIGEAVHLLGVPYHRIWYAVATNKIKPSHRQGRTTLFSDDDLERLKEQLNAKPARRADA